MYVLINLRDCGLTSRLSLYEILLEIVAIENLFRLNALLATDQIPDEIPAGQLDTNGYKMSLLCYYAARLARPSMWPQSKRVETFHLTDNRSRSKAIHLGIHVQL